MIHMSPLDMLLYLAVAAGWVGLYFAIIFLLAFVAANCVDHPGSSTCIVPRHGECDHQPSGQIGHNIRADEI